MKFSIFRGYLSFFEGGATGGHISSGWRVDSPPANNIYLSSKIHHGT